MNTPLWFRKCFFLDEKIAFYASVFTAILVSSDNFSPRDINKHNSFTTLIQLNDYEKVIFEQRAKEYTSGIIKKEICLNELIIKIGKVAKRKPNWILNIPVDKLNSIVFTKGILQMRVLEFLLQLTKNRNKGTSSNPNAI
jgi:hypothetical protein